MKNIKTVRGKYRVLNVKADRTYALKCQQLVTTLGLYILVDPRAILDLVVNRNILEPFYRSSTSQSPRGLITFFCYKDDCILSWFLYKHGFSDR
jgi:hypothetical protein